MRNLPIAYGNSCFAKTWTNKSTTFDELCVRLEQTIRTTESVEEYQKLPKTERDRIKDKGGFVGGQLRDNRRKRENVACRSMLTLDCDHAEAGFIDRFTKDCVQAAWLPEAGYSIAIERSTILEDNLEPGPYERGWLLFPDENSRVRLSNSEMRKVFFDVSNETAEFENLRINEPASLMYKDIALDNVTVTGQWPITIYNSNVTIRNSNYLFLQPGGTSNLTLIDSHIIEFIPREFYGTISFENGTWTNAGEIIGGEDYHSSGNDFTITGSLTIEPEVRQNLQWKNARVTREYTAVVTDQNGNPVSGLTVTIGGQSCTTDEKGEVVFRIIFDETNYNQPTELTISKQSQTLYQEDIDFFTTTPIQITIQE